MRPGKLTIRPALNEISNAVSIASMVGRTIFA